MGRELKFRAWVRLGDWEENGDKRKFIMIDADSFCIEEYEPLYTALRDIEDEYYVMQFTGLTDRNGKDIYENDILAWRGNGNKKNDKLSAVVFNYGSFKVVGITWTAHWILGEINESYEIIGNIYESPELLKQQS